MKRRTFLEMIEYIQDQIREMDIPKLNKFQLIGMVSALEQRYREDINPWVKAKEKREQEESLKQGTSSENME